MPIDDSYPTSQLSIPPHSCSVCGVRFAKAAKRDSHLLDVHGAYYGVTQAVLLRSTSAAVAASVSRAVDAANEAFRLLPPSTPAPCQQCHRKFRNPRDFAQHILCKHTTPDPQPAPSSISVKKMSSAKGKKRINHTPASSSSAAPPRKAIKTEPGTSSSPYGSVKTESKARRAKPKSSPKAVPVEPKPTASKPPLSPKAGSSRESSPKLVSSPPKRPEPTKKKPGRTPVIMDFSTGGGFTPNARKSYYKVVTKR